MTRYVHAEYLPCGDTEYIEPDEDGEFQFPLICPGCFGPVLIVRDA